MNVILDLDNTIICAIEMEYYNKNKDSMRILDEKLSYADMDTSFRIYERPNLKEFLTFVFKHFNVSVFTAASRDYGLFIIENIIKKHVPNAELEFFFHYYHTELSDAYYKSPKDLRLLWEIFPTTFRPEDTIIVDDLADVKNANGFNCINIKAFEVIDEEKGKVNANAYKDKELIYVSQVLDLLNN